MNAVAPTKLTPIDAFRSAFTAPAMMDQVKMVLPKHVNIEKFNRVVLTALQKMPSLLEADRKSLFGACMDAAKDGLIPDGKEAALVPFKGVVTYMPMVTGILKKIRNSGELSSISPHVVYVDDEFDYFVDEKGEHLKHRRNFHSQSTVITCAYVVAIMKDGGVYIEVMTFGEIEAIRKRSPKGNSGPWVSDWAEMAKKTVLRRCSKRLPMSTDIEWGDDDFESTGGEPAAPAAGPVVPPEQAPETEKTVKTASRLKAAMGTPKPVEPVRAAAKPEVVPGPAAEVNHTSEQVPDAEYPETPDHDLPI